MICHQVTVSVPGGMCGERESYDQTDEQRQKTHTDDTDQHHCPEQHRRDIAAHCCQAGLNGFEYVDWTIEQHGNRDCTDRKVVHDGGANLAALDKAVSATVQAANSTEAKELATDLETSWQRLVAVTSSMFATGDVEAALANSAIYLEAFGHTVIAWIWLEQVLASEGRRGDFYEGKRAAARYFYRYELPRVWPQLDLLESLDRTTLEMRNSWF